MSKCPVFQSAEIIGKKWTIVLMQEIALNGDKGFNFISKRMKEITPKILSTRLRELEEKGIIKKGLINKQIPNRSKYTLTDKGKELQNIIESLKVWAIKHSKVELECNVKKCVDCDFYYSKF